MKILNSASGLQSSGRKVCLAIGFFDGVHLGHQQIIRHTVYSARQHEGISLVITFDRHPNTVVAPDRVPPLIYSLPQRIRAIQALGPDALLLIHFDVRFSQQSGESFIRSLARDLGVLQSVCVGANFVFGYKRGGNVQLLRQLGAELNFSVEALAAVALDGKPVSSTRVRQTILGGGLSLAGEMLGRPYSIAGRVIEGDKLGQKIGFPTANLDLPGLVLPPRGVYAAHAHLPPSVAFPSACLESLPSLAGGKSPARYSFARGQRLASPTDGNADHPPSDKIWRAALNIGVRPTVHHPNPQLRVEAHLIDFRGDLYGQELELILLDKIRDERKFASLDELREQIGRDIQAAQARF